jgi:antitoxin component of MazEF toxin-antitoxin module
MTAQTICVNNCGKSLDIRFPSKLIEKTQIKEKPTIQELFTEHPAKYIEENELEWGNPTGGEVW